MECRQFKDLLVPICRKTIRFIIASFKYLPKYIMSTFIEIIFIYITTMPLTHKTDMNFTQFRCTLYSVKLASLKNRCAGNINRE